MHLDASKSCLLASERLTPLDHVSFPRISPDHVFFSTDLISHIVN